MSSGLCYSVPNDQTALLPSCLEIHEWSSWPTPTSFQMAQLFQTANLIRGKQEQATVLLAYRGEDLQGEPHYKAI